MRRRSTLIIGYTIVCLTRMVRLDRIEVPILDNFSLTIFIVSSLTSTEKERTMTEMKNNIRQRPPNCNRPECSSRSQAQAERDASARRKQLAQRVQYDFHPLNGMFVRFKTLYVHFKAIVKQMGRPEVRFHDVRHPYVKHTTKVFSLRLMDFQAQAYPDARRKTRGACQLRRGGQSQSPVHPLCNRKRFSYLPPQSKISRILYAISMRLSGYTSTRSISSSASSVVSASASKIALDASFRLSCRACSSCFCFACANTAA